MGPLPISRTLLAFDLGIGTEARCSSSRQAFQSYQSSWPAVPSSMLVARLLQKGFSYSFAANPANSLVFGARIRASPLAKARHEHRGRNRRPTRLVRLESLSTRRAPRLCSDSEIESQQSPRNRERSHRDRQFSRVGRALCDRSARTVLQTATESDQAPKTRRDLSPGRRGATPSSSRLVLARDHRQRHRSYLRARGDRSGDFSNPRDAWLPLPDGERSHRLGCHPPQGVGRPPYRQGAPLYIHQLDTSSLLGATRIQDPPRGDRGLQAGETDEPPIAESQGADQGIHRTFRVPAYGGLLPERPGVQDLRDGVARSTPLGRRPSAGGRRATRTTGLPHRVRRLVGRRGGPSRDGGIVPGRATGREPERCPAE